MERDRGIMCCKNFLECDISFVAIDFFDFEVFPR